MKISKTKAVVFGLLSSACVSASAATINNPGFESSWDGWTDSDPSAISSDAHEGTKSAKITGSGGAFEQTVAVQANTNYTLSAYIEGTGTIGAEISGSEVTSTGGGSAFEQVSVEFNSGSATSINVFGRYASGTGRFDTFAIQETSTGGGGETGGGDPGSCTGSLTIASASDDGTNDGNVPANAIDGSLATRWSSRGAPKSLVLDLGSTATVGEVAIAWYKGNQRSAYFIIETSVNGQNWQSVLEGGTSSGTTADLEAYPVTETTAQYVRITGYGNSKNNWNSILEVDISGCSDGNGGEPTDPPTDPTDPPPTGNLDPNLPPSGNFELLDWYVSVPTDTDGSGTADSIKENELAGGYEDPNYFYTGSDGGMVFRCPVDGFKTSTNTSYTRTELREMLRRGDTSISTQGVNGNNWVFGSAPSSARNAAGGVDGTLRATLAVNHVTTTGDSGQVGRVIVGQIHANNDEPLRLYYRKLPNNSKGSIYFAHEPEGGSDQWYEMIGSRSSSASDPADGIALDEVFSYEIKVVGNSLTVTIFREGKADVSQTVDMSNSGYDVSDQYQYFKAGVYNQNNTGNADDYVQATFYALENTHTGYAY